MNYSTAGITMCLIISMAAADYNLPPIPKEESRQLGFIGDIGNFPEEKMDFPIAKGPYEPTWESLARHKAPTWWNDAKFGIFIHWGPQAAGNSGDWYARHLYRQGHEAYNNHLKNFGHPSEFGYKDVLNQWNPHEWDPEKIVSAYKDAGFRYALVVGVHHDNYDLWDSKYHPWNSVRVGPKKDFLAGWKRELQKAGMRFGVAFHHEYTWWWWQEAFGSDRRGDKAGIPYDGRLTLADGKGQWWEGLDPRRLYGIPMEYEPVDGNGKAYALHDIAFGRQGIFGNHLDYAHWYATQWAMRIIDVVDNYDPDFVYADGNGLHAFCGDRSGSGYKCDAAARVVAHLYNQDSGSDGDCNKLAIIKFHTRCPGVATTFEGSYARGIKTDQPWMADMAVGDWYYRPDFHYDSRMVVMALLEHVSRGGNFTLCISLTPEGGIDAGSSKMMKEIGQWMRINGEGIYGSHAWKLWGEGKDGRPRVFPGGKLEKKHAMFSFSTMDFRFTQGENGTVYAWCLTQPDPGETVVIRSMGKDAGLLDKPVSSVVLLGSEEKVTWRYEADGLYIQYPDSVSLNHAVGFKVGQDAPKNVGATQVQH